MKIVVIKDELKTVNIDDIDVAKIYAYKYRDEIMKIHSSEREHGNWITIGNNNSWSGSCKISNSITECIKHFQQSFTIYEFKDQDDYFDNARKMENNA